MWLATVITGNAIVAIAARSVGGENVPNIFTRKLKNIIEIEDENKLEVLQQFFGSIISFWSNIGSLLFDLNGEQCSIEKLTEGDFSSIFKVSFGNFTFCVRLLKQKYSDIKKNNYQLICLERENLYNLDDKDNFLKFYGIYVYKDAVFICTEFCEGGNLEAFIRYKLKDYTDPYENICKQLFDIIKSLKAHKLTHGNISLRKILVRKVGAFFKLLLSDLGYGIDNIDLPSQLRCIRKELPYFDMPCNYQFKSPNFKEFYRKKK